MIKKFSHIFLIINYIINLVRKKTYTLTLKLSVQFLDDDIFSFEDVDDVKLLGHI